MKPILILSIDGGGLRGVVPLTILAEVQRRMSPGKELWQCFDLIAGTSTGGLIACALTMKDPESPVLKAKYSLEKILNVYLEDGDVIFPQQKGLNKVWHSVADVWNPKYSDKGIDTIFRKVLGRAKMSDCLTNILVSTYDLNNNRPLFFKSIDRKMNKDLDIELYDICRATSAGPTYLPTYRFNYAKNQPEEKKHRNCVDGGIFVNNPSMAALSEVRRNLHCYDLTAKEGDRADLKNVFVLSIGTGTYSEKFTDEESAEKGLIWWAKEITELMMRGVNHTTHYEMEQMMEKGHYLRLTIDIKNEKYAEMSDSSPATADYLIDAAKDQVLRDAKKMHELDMWLMRAGLTSRNVNAAPITEAADLPKGVDYHLGTLKDLITKINKPEE